MRRLLPVVLMLGLAACGTATPITRPADGYAALRFREPVTAAATLGRYEFQAGTTLVADRRRDSDGQPVFCGVVVTGDRFMRQATPDCFLWRDGVLIAGADKMAEGSHRLSIPPGAIEEFRLR